MVIAATNALAESRGMSTGMVLADARALLPGLEARDDVPGLSEKILGELAEWCIRFTPCVALDLPAGLLMDSSGCAHLWGGDVDYVKAIEARLNARGFDARVAIADTPGVAWAMARYGHGTLVVQPCSQLDALTMLPPEALRIEPENAERLHKLGLHRIGQIVNMARPVLRRRFGQQLLTQIDRALGWEAEELTLVRQAAVYVERLPCLEPIVTAAGISIALGKLLHALCGRLQREQKGLRAAIFRGYRVDNKVVEARVGTHRPTHHVRHLERLFENKLPALEPALGIELFVLEATTVEDNPANQEKMWEEAGSLGDERIAELIDRLVDRKGVQATRYLPAEHYWPERSFRPAVTLDEPVAADWRKDLPRPLQLLDPPEPIAVSAPIPDYPPMLFRYMGKVHRIIKADGPERIEQEWWIARGQHRDYYHVEDEHGGRYWLFRLGHYHDQDFQWFIHGFFA